jgi:hypothetical protein
MSSRVGHVDSASVTDRQTKPLSDAANRSLCKTSLFWITLGRVRKTGASGWGGSVNLNFYSCQSPSSVLLSAITLYALPR